jgi:hypothetical protein
MVGRSLRNVLFVGFGCLPYLTDLMESFAKRFQK